MTCYFVEWYTNLHALPPVQFYDKNQDPVEIDFCGRYCQYITHLATTHKVRN